MDASKPPGFKSRLLLSGLCSRHAEEKPESLYLDLCCHVAVVVVGDNSPQRLGQDAEWVSGPWSGFS